MADFAIVGGGIIGTATAFELSRVGAKVVLLEGRKLAAMASGWTLGGVRQSGRHPAELPLARAAVEIWSGLHDDLGTDVGYRRKGNLRLARSPAEVEIIRKLVIDQAAAELPIEFLDGNAAIRRVAPAVGSGVMAASFCSSDGHADPLRAVRAYADAARRAGCDIRVGVGVERLIATGSKVTGVVTADGTISADAVVVAAGVHTPSLLTPLGLELPMQPHIVSVLQTVVAPPAFDQVFGVANADCAGRQELDGRFRVTTGIGAWPHAVEGWTRDMLQPSCDTVATMIERIAAVLPVIRNLSVADIWGGLIDLTPDGLPVIDRPTGIDGLVVAAGFSGHGFGIAPIVGRIVAALALRARPPVSADAFRLTRFATSCAPQAALTLHG